MKQDEILNMPAGRQMDDLIARRVFGFERLPFPAVPSYQKPVKEGVTLALYDLPRFSEDATRALTIVEALSERWDCIIENNQQYRKYPTLRYGVKFQTLDEDSLVKTIFALADSIPLAICRAALLAVCGE